MLTDTHAHIYGDIYSNVEEVINNSINAKVSRIFNCAEDIKTSKEVIALSEIYEGVLYCSIGIHPHNVKEYSKKNIKEMEKLLNHKNVIAIGEIGLDFHYVKNNKEEQIQLFKAQLDLAQKYNLPVIIHSREATKETLKILKEYNLKGILHCFNEDIETAEKYIKMGYLLGVGGILTFKNSNLNEVIKKIDLEYIVLETDSPYLAPEPYRKYKNEPKYTLEVAKYLAKIKNLEVPKIAKITNRNLSKIFDF